MARKRKPVEPDPDNSETWLQGIKRRLADPVTRREAAVEFGDWAKDLALRMGAGVETAFAVGGTLASGLVKEWRDEG